MTACRGVTYFARVIRHLSPPVADSCETGVGIAHGRKPQKAGLGSGLLALVCADVIRPSMPWLASSLSPHLREAIEAARDPRGFADLRNARMPGQPDQRHTSKALKALARILAAKGGAIDDILAGDVLELLLVATPNSTSHTRLAYALLQSRGQFPPDAPKTLRSIEKRAGQVSPAQLVDRFEVKCKPIRDLLVSYLTERQPSISCWSAPSLPQVPPRHTLHTTPSRPSTPHARRPSCARRACPGRF